MSTSALDTYIRARFAATYAWKGGLPGPVLEWARETYRPVVESLAAEGRE